AERETCARGSRPGTLPERRTDARRGVGDGRLWPVALDMPKHTGGLVEILLLASGEKVAGRLGLVAAHLENRQRRDGAESKQQTPDEVVRHGTALSGRIDASERRFCLS